jgi:hypothetical protein
MSIRSAVRPAIRSAIRSPIVRDEGGGGIPFTISSIFADGTDGFYFDFSQTDQLFQESIGPTPADGAGENIGLALESSKWDGRTLAQELSGQAELVANGDFSAGTTGWTESGVTQSVTSGTLTITNTDAVAGYTSQSFATVVGGYYALSVDALGGTSGTSVRVGTAANFTSNLNGAPAGVTFYVFRATATTTHVTLRNGTATAGLYTEWANVSIKEVPGNHGLQATSSARPSWQTGGLARFDGSNDNLLTPLVAGTANTLMVKLKFGSSVANRVAIGGTVSPSGERLFLGRSSANKVAGGVGNDSLTVINGGSTITNLTGVAALVQDGSTVGLYWNKTLIYSGAQSGALGSAPLRVGAAGATANFFSDDDIYHALAIKKALTATEIADITNLWGTS